MSQRVPSSQAGTPDLRSEPTLIFYLPSRSSDSCPDVSQRRSESLSAVAIVHLVDNSDAATSDPLDDAGDRLRMYTYLTQEWAHTYFAIMRVFSGTLMADLSAADVSIALAPFERDGQIGQGESAID